MKVEILVDDDHAGSDFIRYRKGDVGTVIEHKSRLAGDRWWHYKVALKATSTPEGRGLSKIAYFTNKQVRQL